MLGREHLPPVTIARDDNGGVHELVKKTDLAKALKSAGIEKRAPGAGGSAGDEQRKIKEKQALRRATLMRALAGLVTAVEAAKPDLAFWRFLLSLFITTKAGHDETQVVVKRRALEVAKGDGESAIRTAAEGMKETQLRGLLIELLCAMPPFSYASDYGRALRDCCAHFGIDLKALEGEVRVELATAKKAKSKKAPKPTAPAPKSAKGKPVAKAAAPAAPSKKAPPKLRKPSTPTPTAAPAKGAAPAGDVTAVPERAPLDTRVPTIPLADWLRLSSNDQHRLTWVTYPGQVGTGYTAWKVGETAATAGTLNMGTPHQRALVQIAVELGIMMTWEPLVPKAKSKPVAPRSLAKKAAPRA
jgi:hypothetical protein